MDKQHVDALRQAQLILASSSPRRRELLQQIAVRATVQPVAIDESIRPGESALDFVQRLALEKAVAGFNTNNPFQLPALGSDTIVVIENEILGKPENRQQAQQMLQRLSGKRHKVHTAIAIVRGDKKFVDTSSSDVTFAVISQDEIEQYLATGEADDKAGAYAVQGQAAQFICNIKGSYSGIMGLPIYETVKLLKQCGIRPLEESVSTGIMHFRNRPT